MGVRMNTTLATTPTANAAADPVRPYAAHLSASALPQREPGASLGGRPVRKVRQRASPELLKRVIDGLNQL
jgi:hypothetical protein